MSPEDVVARHEGLVKIQANRYATEQTPFEDLAQEARIELWRQAVKRPGDNLDKLASYIIKRRVIRVSMTGTTFAPGKPGEKGNKKSVAPAVWIDGLEKHVRQVVEDRMDTAPSAEADVLRELTAEQVRAAIRALPTESMRELAWGRLHEEESATTAERIGCTPQAARATWFKTVLPKLRKVLA